MTTFDCVATSESTDHGAEILESANYLANPGLKTGFGAYAPVAEKEKPDEVWSAKHLTSWRQPFSNGVWVLLCVVFVVAGAIYGGLVADGGDDGVGHGIYRAATLYTGAGGPDPGSARGKVFTIFFSFFTLLLVSAYTANLTTFLTVDAIRTQPVTKIEDFGTLGLSPCYYGTTTLEFLQENHPTLRPVDIKSLPTYDPGVERYAQTFQAVRDGYCDGLVMKNNYARNLYVRDTTKDNNGPTGCDIEPTGPEEGVVYYSIPWHGARSEALPFFAAHESVVGSMVTHGMVAALQTRFFPNHPLLAAGCGESADDDELVQYGLNDMYGYFLIAAFAVALGLFGSALGTARARWLARRAAAAAPPGDSDCESDAPPAVDHDASLDPEEEAMAVAVTVG